MSGFVRPIHQWFSGEDTGFEKFSSLDGQGPELNGKWLSVNDFRTITFSFLFDVDARVQVVSFYIQNSDSACVPVLPLVSQSQVINEQVVTKFIPQLYQINVTDLQPTFNAGVGRQSDRPQNAMIETPPFSVTIGPINTHFVRLHDLSIDGAYSAVTITAEAKS